MSSTESKLRTLALTLVYPHRAAYFDDWADCLTSSKYFSTEICNILDLEASALSGKLENCDLVVLLHSCLGDTTKDIRRLRNVLGGRKKARLVAFIGNEFNSPYAPMAEKLALLDVCRPDIIATQLLKEAGDFLYRDIASSVVALPHALNPDAYSPGPPHKKREWDIGVRNFRYSPLLGDQERNRIIDYFADNAVAHGLSVDIDFEKRFVREDWAKYLASCRGTVSSEAGSWYLDRDDALMRKVFEYVKANRSGFTLDDDTPLRHLVRRLPLPVKSALSWVLRRGPVKYAAFQDAELDFDELNELFFKHAARCPAYSKAISSRHFDAIGAKTCQILLRGRYNDILEADKHFLSVMPDHSNLPDIIDQFKDPAIRQRVTDAAYELAMDRHTYAHRAAALHEALQSA
ncbi:MAG: glycosyltransferase [Hyphomicrobiaceae bacterium]|nr:glycosyltransferase [Hyphomicrobiaceae bacterium]